MPGYDGTGPMGQGPMTGRGLGRCGAGNAGQARPLRLGCGWGGRGRGRGFFGFFGRRFTDEVSTEQQCAELENRLADLQQELAELKKSK